ncbi:unnamed protein product [Brassicogethes aeneus]|uniref:MADF domain-containing protein n=1 Tax=Brassicogethes aeneus TaxID=1431903 RepID=A0A9P0FDW1_BRAAE|nr:unnamed protein product [Brassicogethes aeneus]
MKMEWTNKLVLEFVELYSREPVIWNPEHPRHKDRGALVESWQRIHNALSVKHPVKDLKRKKESLMAIFRKQTRRQEEDKNYKSPWFAFKSMNEFLSGIYQPKFNHTLVNFIKQDVNMTDEETSYKEQTEEEITENFGEEDLSRYVLKMNNFSAKHPNDPLEIIKTRSNNLCDDNSTKSDKDECCEDEDEDLSRYVLKMDNFSSKQQNPSTATANDPLEMSKTHSNNLCDENSTKTDKDECCLFAELLASKLRKLDEEYRDVVMHEIDNLVFKARMQQRMQPAPQIRSSNIGEKRSPNS